MRGPDFFSELAHVARMNDLEKKSALTHRQLLVSYISMAVATVAGAALMSVAAKQKPASHQTVAQFTSHPSVVSPEEQLNWQVINTLAIIGQALPEERDKNDKS